MQNTSTVVLEVFEGSNFPPLDQILCCWRVRGSKLETPLPFGDLRSKSNGGEPGPKRMEVGLFVYRYSGTEEYVVCGPVRNKEDEQAEGQSTSWPATGVLHDVSAARSRNGSSEQDLEIGGTD